MCKQGSATEVILPWIGFVLGAITSVLMPLSSWDGLPASPLHTAFGALLTVGALVAGSRLPIYLSSWVAVAVALTVFGSFALGSSWAFITWVPLLTACVLLARLTPMFLLGLLATIVIRDAPTLVLLSETRAHSGSFQYFVAFASATLLPALIYISNVHAGGLRSVLARWSMQLALGLLGGLAAWAILVSGSRAAFVGALAGVAVALLALALSSSRRSRLGRALVVLAIALASIGPMDIGLSAFYGDGRPIALDVFVTRLGATASEIERDGPGSISTRVAFWRQAARILVARPIGHGPASYGHVNHAYQSEPLLWSGSPHSIWALTAVETGALGVLALGLLCLRAFLRAFRRHSALVGSLLAATIVMSLDVFASMPAKSIVWWASVGAAWGLSHSRGQLTPYWRTVGIGIPIVAILILSLFLSFRLDSSCDAGCDPVAYYGGNPRLTGPLSAVAEDPADPAWDAWESRYPLAFWLASAQAAQVDAASGSIVGARGLLRDFPFQSLERYLIVAASIDDSDMAASYAACGLARFFGDTLIWRDWRSSSDQMRDLRAELRRFAGNASKRDSACSDVNLPREPIGLR